MLLDLAWRTAANPAKGLIESGKLAKITETFLVERSITLADSGYKNVSRIDSPKKKLHGWYVRIQYKNQSFSKFFSDSRYGNRSAALEEAVEYRNQLEEKIGRPRTERLIIGNITSRPPTGVTGVRRIKRKEVKRGRRYIRDVYEITWNPEPGKLTRTTVSINKYGEEEAFRRACEIRKRKMQEIYEATREPDFNGTTNGSA